MDKKTKLISLDVVLAAAALLLSLSFNPFFKAASLDVFATKLGAFNIFILGSVFIIWAIIVSLISYFSPSFDRLLISFSVSSLVFAAALTGIGNILVRFLLSVLLIPFLFIFAAKVKSEAGDYINFNISKIFKPSLKLLTVLTFILFSIGFFFPYRASVEQQGFRAPELLIDRVVEIVGRTMIEAAVGQIAKSSKLPNKEAVFVEIPEEIGEAGLMKTFEEEFGIKINRVPQSSADLLGMLKPSLEQKIRTQIEETLSPLTSIIPAIISFLLFLTLLPLATIAAFIITPLLSLAFFLLEALELTIEEEKSVTTTRPVLK